MTAQEIFKMYQTTLDAISITPLPEVTAEVFEKIPEEERMTALYKFVIVTIAKSKGVILTDVEIERAAKKARHQHLLDLTLYNFRKREDKENLYCTSGDFVCNDCGEMFYLPVDIEHDPGGILWKEWDFDPSEGTEPLAICNKCTELEKHLERVRRDKEAESFR